MQAELPQPVRAKVPVHYGWVILGAGTFGSVMTLPGQSYAAVLAVCCGLALMCGAAAFVVSCPSAMANKSAIASPMTERTS